MLDAVANELTEEFVDGANVDSGSGAGEGAAIVFDADGAIDGGIELGEEEFIDVVAVDAL